MPRTSFEAQCRGCPAPASACIFPKAFPMAFTTEHHVCGDPLRTGARRSTFQATPLFAIKCIPGASNQLGTQGAALQRPAQEAARFLPSRPPPSRSTKANVSTRQHHAPAGVHTGSPSGCTGQATAPFTRHWSAQDSSVLPSSSGTVASRALKSLTSLQLPTGPDT